MDRMSDVRRLLPYLFMARAMRRAARSFGSASYGSPINVCHALDLRGSAVCVAARRLKLFC